MEFKLPELGEGVHEGELVKWKVKAGDSVVNDQPLCDVMTDKATIEIPASFDGKIVSVNSLEGHPVKVGDAQMADTGGGQVEDGWGPKPAGAEAKDAGLLCPRCLTGMPQPSCLIQRASFGI